MKKVPVYILIISVIIAVIIAGTAGFVIGVASTKAGEDFLSDLAGGEQMAETANSQTIKRQRFELSYPSNWLIDTDDEDYDPDHLFSIESPGSSFAMFIMDTLELDPEESLQEQIEIFSNMMGNPDIENFTAYGQYKGKGAYLRGKMMGMSFTIKVFTGYINEQSVIIVHQYPDEDHKMVKDGLKQIEDSFKILPKE